MAKFKLKQGDIFSIPLVEDQIGFGQIINFPNSKDVFIMGCFDVKNRVDSIDNVDNICQFDLVLLSYCTDAKIYHGQWELIGNCDRNLNMISLPYFKLGSPPDELYLIDFKSTRKKAITLSQFEQLNYKTTFSPVRYENALKAHFGFQPWVSEDYDRLTYKEVLRSVEVAKSILE
jgi:hypothetical protein